MKALRVVTLNAGKKNILLERARRMFLMDIVGSI
jgi:hypothetical protein